MQTGWLNIAWNAKSSLIYKSLNPAKIFWGYILHKVSKYLSISNSLKFKFSHLKIPYNLHKE